MYLQGNKCLGYGSDFFFLIPDRLKFWIRSGKIQIRIHEKAPKNCKYKQKFLLFHIQHSQHCPFCQVSPKPNKKTSFRSHQFVNGQFGRFRIRVFNVRILIGEKTRIRNTVGKVQWDWWLRYRCGQRIGKMAEGQTNFKLKMICLH